MLQSQVLVTTIGCLLDPLMTRDTRLSPPGRTVREYVLEQWPLFSDMASLIVAVDGNVVGDDPLDVVMGPGQSLLLAIRPGKGGGKSPIATVAMLALSIAAPYMAPTAWVNSMAVGMANTFGVSAAMSMGTYVTLATRIIGAGIALVGGVLISSVFGGGAASVGDPAGTSLAQSATYSWTNDANPVVEGGVCPVLYGTMRITPPCVGRYIELGDDGKQYFNGLYLVADHAVDYIDDIEINNTPLVYYENVTTEKRYGTPDQAVMPNFTDSISQKASGAVLSTSPVVIRTDGNAVEDIAVSLLNPAGLCYFDNGGNVKEASFTYKLRFRKVGDVDWTDWLQETVTAATNNEYRTYKKLGGLPTPGQYDIEASFVVQPTLDARTRTLTKLEFIHEIIHAEQRYPGRSLLSVRALATDKLSGGWPTISCIAKRLTVSVSDGTTTYSKTAMDPAWAGVDLMESAHYGGSVAGNRIAWAQFEEWSDWNVSRGFETHIYLDAGQDMVEALKNITRQGRGNIVQIGSKFTCIVDKPEVLPAQRFMFTVANMTPNTFQQQWLPIDSRATSIEVTYFDASANHSRQMVLVQRADFDSSVYQDIRTSIILYGCTSRDQAVSYGLYLLNCNRYLTETVSFVADIDAIGCMPGDVVDVQHDLPQYGWGGRLVSVDGTSAVLDQEITMVPGTTYALEVKRADDTRLAVTLAAVGAPTTTDTVTLTSAWPGAAPEADDIYQFGPVGSVSKPFRILTITRSSDQQRKVQAIEYNTSVYDDAPSIPVSDTLSGLRAVYAVNAAETFDIVSGVPIPRVILSWAGAALSWDVYFRAVGQVGWSFWKKTTEARADIAGSALQPATTYEFQVRAGNTVDEATLEYMGGPVPPDITGLYGFSQNNLPYISADPVDVPWAVSYVVKKGSAWMTAQLVGEFASPTVQVPGPGTYFMAARCGMAYSPNPASVTVTTDGLVANVIAEYDEVATGWSGTRDDSLVLVGDEMWLVGTGDMYLVDDLYAEEDLYTIGGVAPEGIYTVPEAHRISLSQESICRVTVDYELRGEGISDDLYDDMDLYASADLYGAYGQYVSARPEIRMYRNGSWGPWVLHTPGDYAGEIFDFRLVVRSADTGTIAIVSNFSFTVDVPDRVVWTKGVLVGTGGLDFVHNPPFNAVPSTVVQILDAQPGDQVVLLDVDQTEGGGHVAITNGGVAVSRSVNLIHQGY